MVGDEVGAATAKCPAIQGSLHSKEQLPKSKSVPRLETLFLRPKRDSVLAHTHNPSTKGVKAGYQIRSSKATFQTTATISLLTSQCANVLRMAAL